jgi:tetratricopeptide (TPR) repeat protein
MRPPRSLAVVLLPALFVLSVPPVLSAQAPALRAQLVALRDSVSRIASADDASARAAARHALLQRDQSDAVLLLQAGLVQLRLGQLSPDRAPLDQAQALFDEAIYRAPDTWPWPWYGLALTDLALDSTDAVVKASMHAGAGVYYHDAALHALGKALAADSSFVPAAALLGDILLPFGERALNGELKEAVRRAAATNQAALPWLALGRVYRNLHQADSAVWAFQHYVAIGGDSGLGLLEQARSLYDLGQVPAATTAYLAGANLADSLARDNYRRDLAWVASPEELAAFDAVPGDSVGAFVGAFWAKRDAEELRAPGERLAEHVRRWRYIFEHFQLSARAEGTPQRGGADCGPGIIPSLRDDGAAPQDMASPDLQLFEPGVYAATWRGKRLVDDRGVIYMRHGEPNQRAAASVERTLSSAPLPGSPLLTEATPVQTETRPNESWKYVTSHGTLLFHFCGSLALGTSAATTLVEMLPLNPEMIGARSGLDPRFAALEGEIRMTNPDGRSRILTASTSGAARRLTESLARDGRRDIAVGLSTDEFAPEFKRQIEVHTQFFAVGQPDQGSGTVLAVFAFAGDQLTPTPLPQGGVVYPLALRLIATDAAGHIHRIDTTRYFRSADTLRQGQFLFGTEELPVGAGTWDVRLLVTQPKVDAGGAIERREVTLAAGGTLGLSDLVFGREGSGLRWQSAGGTVPLSPLDAYPRSGSVEVYYELSGAESGRHYQTQLELAGVSGDAKGDVRLGFSEQANGTLLRLRRSVALDPIKGGQYRMTVTVTEDGTGKSVTRSRLLNVIR